MSTNIARVVVIGAGPAGSVAAAALASSRVSVILLDRARPSEPNAGECLTPAIRPLLERAGVWQEFLEAGHLQSSGIRSAWGSAELAASDFVFSPYGFGWHIDRSRFDAMLTRAAVRNGASLIPDASLRSIEFTGCRRWRIRAERLGNGVTLEADFAIDATGRASAFGRRCGSSRIAVDRLTGTARYFSPGRTAAEPSLLVEAMPDGWWYSAPLASSRLVSVYMTDADLIRDSAWDVWIAASRETHQRLSGHAGNPERTRTVLADSSFLHPCAGEACLATGDAAASHDPLSSQGILAAVESGLDAASTVLNWFGGRPREAVENYAERVARSYRAYLVKRRQYYSIEHRWPDSAFWQRRHAATVPPELSAHLEIAA